MYVSENVAVCSQYSHLQCTIEGKLPSRALSLGQCALDRYILFSIGWLHSLPQYKQQIFGDF